MKDKEKQIFDKYGNYDFPTEIKQDELNTATTQIEEMAKIMRLHICKDRPCKECDCHGLGDKTSELYHCDCYYYAESIIKQGYRKLPENAFILTDDNAEELANLIVTSPQMQSVMSDLIKAWQKETAEKILNEVYFYASNKETVNLLTRIKEIATREGVEIKE